MDKVAYGINVQYDYYKGIAYAFPAAALPGTEITLTAEAYDEDYLKESYHFKEWQVISGNVTINENKFTMPAEFAPNEEITREQLAAILYRYAQFKGLDVSAKGDLIGFADGAAVSGWAQEAMQWAVGAGLLNGNADGTLAPTAGATRAEVAMILMRFMQA